VTLDVTSWIGRRFFPALLLPLVVGAGAAEAQNPGPMGYVISGPAAGIVEGDAGTVMAVFDVQLINKDTPSEVDFATQDGSATTADNDYGAMAGTLFFTGAGTQQVMVPINGDTIPEFDEQFSVVLSNPTQGEVILQGTAFATILDDDPPTISIGDAAITEGDAGTVDLTFTVTVTPEPLNGDVIVDFATQDGSATTADNDYDAASGQLIFPSQGVSGGRLGPVSQVVTVTVNGDANVEEDEVLFVNLSNPTGGTIVDGQGDGTILNDDLPVLSIDDVTVNEGDAGTVPATFTVTLSEAPPADVTVNFATRDGSATATGGDYNANSGFLLFPGPQNAAQGPITQTITVDVNGDTTAEGNEDFFVDLTGAVGATVADSEGMGTILDDDTVVLSIGDVAVFEGDAGTTDAVFQVTLSAMSKSPVTVTAATRDGTATTADNDYDANEEQLTFNPGQTTATFAVSVRGDDGFEPDETFHADLSGVVGGILGDAEGQGTIRNDDEEDIDTTSEIRLLEPASVGEAAGSATVSIQRTGGFGAASVSVSAGNGSAEKGPDFDLTTQTVSWADGETGNRTVAVDIVDDNLEEGDETLSIALGNVSGAVIVGPSSRDLTILDNDMPMSIESLVDAETLSVVNGEVGMQVRVTRDDGMPVQGAVVLWRVVEGDAELSEGDETMSNEDGVAENMALLGTTPGTVVIAASLLGSDTETTFEITVEGDLENSVDPLTNPGEASVARVLDESCAEAVGDFAEACSYLFGLTDPAARQQALRELTPREASAQGTMSVDAMRVQLRNVGSRLAALRSGATGKAVDQLAFRTGQDVFTLAQLRGDSQVKADAAFMSLLEGAWWDDSIADEGGAMVDTDLDQPSRWGAFVNGQLTMGDKEMTLNEEGFEFDSTGVTAGVDYRVSDRTVVGGAAGFLTTDMSLDRRGGGLDADGLSLSGYALVYGPAAYFTSSVTWGEIDFDLVRNVDLPEPFQGQERFTARGATDSDQFSIALEGGYDKIMEAATLGGFVRASYIDAAVGEYVEDGAGPFSLAIRNQDIESLLGEAGVSWSYAASRSWGILMPSLRASYLHEFEDSSRLIRGRFVGDILGNEFAVPTDSPDRNFFNLGGGLTFTLPKGRSFFLFVDSDLERDDLSVFTASFGFRFEL